MNALSALVVDAHLRSRRALLAEISATQLFETVLEADSLADAFVKVRQNNLAACILGASLTRRGALEFVTRAKAMAPTSCAIIAIRVESVANGPELIEAGADVLLTPGHNALDLAAYIMSALTTSQARLPIRMVEQVTLASRLEQAAKVLRSTSHLLTMGQLKPFDELGLSPAVRDSLRLAFEQAFAELPDHTETAASSPSDPNNHDAFVESLIDWFTACLSDSRAHANEQLKRKSANG